MKFFQQKKIFLSIKRLEQGIYFAKLGNLAIKQGKFILTASQTSKKEISGFNHIFSSEYSNHANVLNHVNVNIIDYPQLLKTK